MQGYGRGDYIIHPAEEGLVFGEDFAEILGYFQKLRENRCFNSRADVSPVSLKQYLPWISLVEPQWGPDGRIHDGTVTLHGSAVAAAYTDNTQKNVRSVHKPMVADRIMASMQTAADIGGGVIGVSEERPEGGPHVRMSILYLPLANDGVTIDLFFSYLRLDPLD
ncbi:MAG: hypothetical protein HWE08_05835 [Alphaproteobacteria bacterium]|nr:hypothetical protein [Alphaproteobacteria bacterium]